MSRSPSSSTRKKRVGDVSRTTISALREDAALLKEMIADNEDKKRTKAHVSSSKPTRKPRRNKSAAIPLELTSIREETARDISSPDPDTHQNVQPNETEPSTLFGPYDDDDKETKPKKQRKKKKIREVSKKSRLRGTATDQINRVEGVGKKQRRSAAKNDRNKEIHAAYEQSEDDNIQNDETCGANEPSEEKEAREVSNGFQPPPHSSTPKAEKDTMNADSRRSEGSGFRQSSHGDSTISDITSDSKAWEKIQQLKDEMTQKRPPNIESKKTLSSSEVSDLSDDSKREIVKQIIAESDKDVYPSNNTAQTWAKFDEWQAAVHEVSIVDQSFSAQPKSTTISDLDKWDPFESFNDKLQLVDDQDLIEKWKISFECGGASNAETNALISQVFDSRHHESIRIQSSNSIQESERIMQVSAPVEIESGSMVAPIQPTADVTAEKGNSSARRRSTSLLTAPRSSFRVQDDATDNSFELLARYIQSMGADPQESRDVARSFAESQSRRQMQVSDAGRRRSHLTVSNDDDVQSNSDFDNGERALLSGSERTQTETVSRSSVVGASFSATSTPTGTRRHRIFWPRFETPGAVQMNTRAFGAPFRSTASPAGDIEHGSTSDAVHSGEVILEATAVSDDENQSRDTRSPPVVYAEKLSFASWARQHSFIRSVMVLLAFAMIVVVATVLAVRLPNNDTPASTATGSNAGGSPSEAPTFISSDFLEALEGISGYESLSYPGSPQRRAVGWLSTVDQSGIEATDSRLLQRYILVVLYFATSGESWIEREQWLHASLHECLWGSGSISCKTDASGMMIVTGLDLSRHGMKGGIPREVGYLQHVEHFIFSRNYLNGTLPDSIFNMSRLAVLDLHSNSLSGTIPSMENAPYIVDLDLSRNAFSGKLPEALYDLSILRTLDVSANQISGVLESGLGKLRVLTKLNVKSNLISGTIPDTFDVLTNLAVINLDNNMYVSFRCFQIP